MSRKSLAVGLIIGLFVGLVSGYFLPQILSSHSPVSEITNPIDEITNPKITCNVRESGTSSWYKSTNYTTGNSPVIGGMFESGEIAPMPQTANLGVNVFNNNSQSLFNIVVEVSYRTTEDKWNTTSRIAIGFLDIQESKEVKMALVNPYLTVWQTRQAVYSDPSTHWRNGTAYVLEAIDYKIVTAYGFAKP